MIEIRQGYIPGSIGRVTELHGSYYQEHWGFGLFFEAQVATQLAIFLQRYDRKRDGFWTVSSKGRIEGSIAIDSIDVEKKGAHLRFFILSHRLRGKGLGKQLLSTAVEFCRTKHYSKIYLWSFEGLNNARYLYEKVGFKLTAQQKGTRWGREVNEQQFELQLE